MSFGENDGGGSGLLGAGGNGLDVIGSVGIDVGSAEVFGEFDRCVAQGRHVRATTPINRMVAAALASATKVRRDPAAPDLSGSCSAAGAGAAPSEDLRGCGAA